MLKLIWKKKGTVADKACLLWFFVGVLGTTTFNMFMKPVYEPVNDGWYFFFQFAIAIGSFLLVRRVKNAEVV